MMARFFSRRPERSVYLPWERRGVLGRVFGAGARRRILAYVLLGLVILALVRLDAQNRGQRRVRETRAALARTRAALDAYRADHGGACPRDLRQLATPTVDRPPYLAAAPVDAWQRPLRLSCPGRDGVAPYDLASDGPDGDPWGRDRID